MLDYARIKLVQRSHYIVETGRTGFGYKPQSLFGELSYRDCWLDCDARLRSFGSTCGGKRAANVAATRGGRFPCRQTDLAARARERDEFIRRISRSL